MERPTILLAVSDDADEYVEALQRAGFDPITVELWELGKAPATNLAVIDCDLPAEMVTTAYARLHDGQVTPSLLLIGETGERAIKRSWREDEERAEQAGELAR